MADRVVPLNVDPKLPVEWVDQPPPMLPKGTRSLNAGQTTRWVVLAAGALMTRPGEWGCLTHKPFQIGSALRIFRSLGCESTTRQRDDGRVDVYARYVGDEG